MSEIPLKQWIVEEAIRRELTLTAIRSRLARGKYPHLKLRRVNQRVVFVSKQANGDPGSTWSRCAVL